MSTIDVHAVTILHFILQAKRASKSIYISLRNLVLIKCLYLKQEKKRDLFKQQITPVEIGQTVATVKLLIVERITAHNKLGAVTNRFNVLNFKFGII